MWILTQAFAQTVVDVAVDDGQASDLGLDGGSIEGELEGAISDGLALADAAAYLNSFAEANAIATKGMGVDYATNPKKLSIGLALGTGVSGIPFRLSRGGELPTGGYSFMATAHAGVNVGGLLPGDNALDRLTIYVNGLAFQPPSSRSFEASMLNYGAHAQFKLFGPVKAAIVEWGGLDLTTGYERSTYTLTLSDTLPIEQSVPVDSLVGSSTADLRWDATGTYDLTATSSSVPVELSTNLRLAVVTIYGGAGVDFNTADATSGASLTGPLSATIDSEESSIGTATVSVAGLGTAASTAPRGFVGVQLNALMVKVFAHLNVGANQTYGGFAGVRVAL